MSEIEPNEPHTDDSAAKPLSTVRLVGFSPRDADLLKLFLRRPTGSGVTLQVVDEEPADLLIANMQQPEAVMAVRRRKQPGRTIGLVTQFSSDAAYYQVQQNSQLLYSLAQGINRIREGWYPPHLSPHTSTPAHHATPEPSVETQSAAPPQVASTPPRNDMEVPRVEPTAAQGAMPNHEALPWQRSLSILVVDDSKFSRVAIQEALGKVGFAVETAVDGEEGLRMAIAKHYDVALIDFEMPGIKGPEVIRRMRALGANTPQILIMLTSRTGTVDRLRAKIAGCDAYLTKPTKMSEFVTVLTQFAQQGRLKRN
ncbi:MAG: response regulator [Casimicrobium sp.]